MTPREAVQGDLFTAAEREQEAKLMDVVDQINSRYGRGTLFFAASGIKEKPWHMKQVRRSPRFTTRWDELARVRA